jgi:hypothetical protein
MENIFRKISMGLNSSFQYTGVTREGAGHSLPDAEKVGAFE